MTSKETDRSQTENRHASPASRFFLLSTATGLLVGLFEAALLWMVPRGFALLGPFVGVRYVIWFLAPLVDMIFFGLLGLVLGWAARHTRHWQALAAVLTASSPPLWRSPYTGITGR